MECIFCHQAQLVIKTGWRGVNIGCPGCGRIYTPEDVKELLRLNGGGEVPKPSCPR